MNDGTQNTKLQQYEAIQPFVQKEIADMFEQQYKQYATKYGVASVPLHRHNGADAPTIGDESITNFGPLPSTEGGVANLLVLGGQLFNNEVDIATGRSLNGNGSPPKVFVMTVPVVYGYGVGSGSAFNGGDAPEGTVLLFSNGDGINQILWRAGTTWRGINVDGSGTVTGVIA